jgi:hypothetical protein
MASFATLLSESSPAWHQAVAPVAEWVSRMLWSMVKTHRSESPPTHLTQSRRREAKGKPHLHISVPPRPPRLCRTCGKLVTRGYDRCGSCKVAACTEELIKSAQKGRVAAHSPKAEAKRGESRLRHAAKLKDWQTSDRPTWLTEEIYRREVQPKLADVATRNIKVALGISKGYATNIRAGRVLPHPRHWQTLAGLVEVSGASPSVRR